MLFDRGLVFWQLRWPYTFNEQKFVPQVLLLWTYYTNF